MQNGIKIFHIAFDLFAVCVLISLIILGVRRAISVNNAASESLNAQKTEFMQSDLTLLEGSTLPGSSVISAVKKYQNKIDVKVVTVRGGNNTYNKHHRFVNTDPNKAGYIRTSASFVCTHDENLNGVITQINFVEQGVNIGNADVTNIDDAKTMLVDSMSGLTNVEYSQKWQELTERVRAELALTSKTQLATALGAQYLDTDTWAVLSAAAVLKIQDLEKQIATDDQNPHDASEHVCMPLAETELSFYPSIAVVSSQNSSEKYFFTDNLWYSDGSVLANPPFTIELVNRNGAEQTVLQNQTNETLQIKIYK